MAIPAVQRAAFPYHGCGRGPAILLVSSSHGFPPSQARLARAAEFVRDLTARGAVVDWVVLVERRLEFVEEDSLLSLRALVRHLHIVDHPRLDSLRHRIGARFLEALSVPVRLGGRQHAPRRLLRLLASARLEGDYQAVLACGAHLAEVLALFPDSMQKILDVPRIGSEVYREHAAAGRTEGLEVFADSRRELRLLSLAETVVVSSLDDAVALRARGLHSDLVLTPPSGRLVAGPSGPPPSEEPWEVAAPRILCVGSETPANLDGVLWFRRHVFPRILKVAPTCRLRVVGEVGRPMDPSPGTDRMGSVPDIEPEYANAAIVALPLRMGSGIRRRAVEALVRGKVLCATEAAARGLGVRHLQDAVVSDDPAILAEEAGRILTCSETLHNFEERSVAAGRKFLDSEARFGPLADVLGLPRAPETLDIESHEPALSTR